jgi:hypothetical protein
MQRKKGKRKVVCQHFAARIIADTMRYFRDNESLFVGVESLSARSL